MRSERSSLGVDFRLHELAQALEKELDGLVETMLGRMRDEVPDFDIRARPELDDALRASCYGNLRTRQ